MWMHVKMQINVFIIIWICVWMCLFIYICIVCIWIYLCVCTYILNSYFFFCLCYKLKCFVGCFLMALFLSVWFIQGLCLKCFLQLQSFHYRYCHKFIQSRYINTFAVWRWKILNIQMFIKYSKCFKEEDK